MLNLEVAYSQTNPPHAFLPLQGESPSSAWRPPWRGIFHHGKSGNQLWDLHCVSRIGKFMWKEKCKTKRWLVTWLHGYLFSWENHQNSYFIRKCVHAEIRPRTITDGMLWKWPSKGTVGSPGRTQQKFAPSWYPTTLGTTIPISNP